MLVYRLPGYGRQVVSFRRRKGKNLSRAIIEAL